MLTKVFSAIVQNEVRNKILIKASKIKALFALAVRHTEVMDSNDIRHQATNYDSLTRSKWYIDLKAEYGEAIHLFLKHEITNKINSTILNLAESLFAEICNDSKLKEIELKHKIREVKEQLEAETDSFLYEIEQLKKDRSILKTEVNVLSSAVQELIEKAGVASKNLDVATSKIENLQVDLEVTKENLEVTKENLEVTKENLEVTKENLEVTREELKQLKHDLNTFDAKEASRNIRAATEALRNLVRKESGELMEIEVTLDETEVALVNTRVKTEMLDRVVSSKVSLEDAVDFTLTAESTLGLKSEVFISHLDALILQATKLETRLKEIKTKILMKPKVI